MRPIHWEAYSANASVSASCAETPGNIKFTQKRENKLAISFPSYFSGTLCMLYAIKLQLTVQNFNFQIRRHYNVLDVQHARGAGAASVGGIALLPDRHHIAGRSVGYRADVSQV
jgi:hypothetical protein